MSISNASGSTKGSGASKASTVSRITGSSKKTSGSKGSKTTEGSKLSNESKITEALKVSEESYSKISGFSMISEIYRASEIRPNCAECEKPITDTVVAALGQTWHPEHFTCTHCGQPIRETAFHVKKEKPYCELDYIRLFVKTCISCGKRIPGTVLVALNETWHQECFRCVECKRIIGLKEFTEKDGSPYCIPCGKPEKSLSKMENME